MINLEPLAAQAATRMVGGSPNDALNLINKALMVLAEQGLFAYGLFLGSRKRDKDRRQAADDLHQAVTGLLAEAGLMETPQDNPATAEYYRALTMTRDGEAPAHALQRIILTKHLVEIALTYGRYQAKARSA